MEVTFVVYVLFGAPCLVWEEQESTKEEFPENPGITTGSPREPQLTWLMPVPVSHAGLRD